MLSFNLKAEEKFDPKHHVEKILGNTSAERGHLTAAQPLFEAKGNVVRAREATRRLGDLTADG